MSDQPFTDRTVWRKDQQMESVLKMKERDPAGYDALAADIKLQVGFYLSDRDRARAAEKAAAKAAGW